MLYNWLCLNKLSLNVDKSNYMLFSTTKIKWNYYLDISNNNVKKWIRPNFLKFITMKDHISYICKKTTLCIAIWNKVKYILNTKCMYALYYALILPHLQYCLEVWGNNYKNKLNVVICFKRIQFVLFVKVPYFLVYNVHL